MKCPECDSKHIVKNGFTPKDKQKYKCADCKKQFVLNPIKTPISEEKKEWVENLLLEKIGLNGIMRSTKVSKRWLQYYVNKKYKSIVQKVTVKNKPKCSLIIEADEAWSYCGMLRQAQHKKRTKTMDLACYGQTSKGNCGALYRR